MYNQPSDLIKYTLVTRQQDLDRELKQIAMIKEVENCPQKPSFFQKYLEKIGWAFVSFGNRIASRNSVCECA